METKTPDNPTSNLFAQTHRTLFSRNFRIFFQFFQPLTCLTRTLRVKSSAWASRAGHLPQLWHTGDRRWLHHLNPLLQSITLPPCLARKEHQRCLNRSLEGLAKPSANFPAKLRIASKHAPIPTKCSRILFLDARIKSPLTNLSKMHQNMANFNAKFWPKPSLIYSKILPPLGQSPTKTWPPSKPPSDITFPSPLLATCG